MATDREIQELTRLAGELITRLDALVGGTSSQMVQLAETGHRNRKLIWALWASFALDILLTVVIAVYGTALAQITTRVDDTQARQTNEVLCPLYRLFLEADTEANRKRAVDGGADPKVREQAFAEIRSAYKVLECKE